MAVARNRDVNKGHHLFQHITPNETLRGWQSVLARIRATVEDLISAFEHHLNAGTMTLVSCFEKHETETDKLATLVEA
jgi:hypothetical protein